MNILRDAETHNKSFKAIKKNSQKRRVFVGEAQAGIWGDYLRSFFEDATAEVFCSHNVEIANSLYDQARPDLCFVEPAAISHALFQKLKVRCETDGEFYLFKINAGDSLDIPESKSNSFELPYLCQFDPSQQGIRFLHKLMRHLQLPSQIRLLIVDGDFQTREQVIDYLEDSVTPVFKLVSVSDGIEAIEIIKAKSPDMVILGDNITGKSGWRVYEYIRLFKPLIPVLVYMDVMSSKQVTPYYQLGRPFILDKRGEARSMPTLTAFLNRMLFFEGITARTLCGRNI